MVASRPTDDDEGEISLSSPEERRRRDVGRLLRLFARLATPYIRRERRAKIDAAVVLASVLANNGISVAISFISRDFWSALNTKDQGLFYHQALAFFGVLCVAVPVMTLGSYFREMAALRWRSWMTETVMREYLTQRAFYDIDQDGSLDNPDQRLSADIAAFTSESLSFILTVVTSVIDIASFSLILWSIEPSLFVTLIAYATSGTLATAYVGRRFVALNRRQLVREADFRYGLMRLRENAESVAFFRGETRENKALSHRLQLAVSNATNLIGWQRNLGFLQSAYRYLVQVLPALVVAPRYFSGAVELGTVTQSFGAFSHTFSDLSLLVNRFDSLSQLGAQISRIQELCDAVEANIVRDDRIFNSRHSSDEAEFPKQVRDEARTRIAICEASDGSLAMDKVCVSTPSLSNPRSLVNNVSFKLGPGERLLIAGPSGVGKSSLIRAIAGLWTNGRGVITRPASSDVFFLPQRPFMTLGSLAEQLVYPKSIEDDDAPSDAVLLDMLDTVDLHELPARMGGLSAVCDWGDTLSLGEQQRLSFARLLIARPKLAVCDESTRYE